MQQGAVGFAGYPTCDKGGQAVARSRLRFLSYCAMADRKGNAECDALQQTAAIPRQSVFGATILRDLRGGLHRRAPKS